MTRFVRINSNQTVNSARIIDIGVRKSALAKDTPEIHGAGGEYSIYVNVEKLGGSREPLTVTLMDSLTDEVAALTVGAIEVHLNSAYAGVSLPKFLIDKSFKEDSKSGVLSA